MKLTKVQLRRIIKEELGRALRNESREDHISGVEGRLDKSRRRAGNLEPGGYKQRELAQRKMMQDNPFDAWNVDPNDEESWDELTRKEKGYVDDKSMTSLNPDQERERADLLNKIARLEKELARLKSA
tara:strand:+ start:551 stop:934 length:384 start_codon:yes stop_codon:yes gene_type:complete